MKQFSRAFINTTLGFVSIVCLVTLMHWQFNVSTHHYFRNYLGNINPTVALTLIICCLTILLLQNVKAHEKNKILTIKFFSLLFFLVGAAKVFSIVFHFDLLVDKILFSNKLPPDIFSNPQKGMSFYAALNFMLLGISFLVIVAQNSQLKKGINYLLLLAIFNCIFGLMGYLFHAPALINLEGFHPMLWSVSLCFALLFIDILLINKGYAFMFQFSSNQAGGRFAQILLPCAVLIPILSGYLSIWLHWHFEVNYELGLSLLVFAIIVIMFFTTWFVAATLNDFDRKQHDWERKKNLHLETIVQERTRQLSLSQKESFDYQFALDEAAIVAITDQKGIIKYVNDNFCRISKYSKEELIGQDHRLVNSGFHSKDFMQDLWRTIAQGKIWKGDIKNKAKNGTIYWVETTIVPFLNNDGKPYQYLAIRSDITDKKIAEEKLKASESHFKALIENAPDVIVLIDAEGKILYASPSFEKTTGFSMHEMIGMSAFAIVHPDSIDTSKTKVQEVLKNPGIVYPRLNHFLCKDGSSIWCEGSMINMLHDENINAIVVNYKNITDRRIAEEKLKESETRFRALIENAPDVILMVDENWKAKYISPSFEKLTGYNLEEVQAMNQFQIVHPDSLQFIKEIHQNSLKNPGKVYPRVNKLICKDDSVIWCEGTVINLLHEKDVKAIVVNFRNITDKKLAEEKYRESETRFKLLIENNYDGVLLGDANDHIFYQSPAVERITGWRLEEIQQHGILNLVHPDDLDELKMKVESVFAHPESVHHSVHRLQHKNGNYIWVDATFTNLINTPGINGLLVNISDVTEKKMVENRMVHINEELEEKVTQRTTDLEKTNKELEMFTYSVSHDLRTPLGAIDGFATLLDEFHKGSLDEEAREYLKNIRHSTQRMSRLIEDLLNLSKLGKKNIIKTDVDMNEVVKKVLHDYEAANKHKSKIQIANLPHINGDASILEQVWMNLISNAIKYSSKKENPTVEIGCTEKATDYEFFIRDNGAGFDMQYVDKLFGVFQRMHKNSEFEGTGVGLAIVKLIVEKHYGRIWVNSKLNEGTTFYFTIPKSVQL